MQQEIDFFWAYILWIEGSEHSSEINKANMLYFEIQNLHLTLVKLR